MALIEKEDKVYLHLKHDGVECSKNGNKKLLRSVTGVVTGVRYANKKFIWQGKNIEFRELAIEIRDGSDKYTLTEKADSKAGRQLQLKLLNSRVGDFLKITPTDKDKDKKSTGKLTGVYVNCGEEPILQKYTIDNPGACPQWEKILVKGKEQWDNTKELQFLEAEMTKHFENAAAVEHASQQGEFHESEIPQWEESPSDDTPPF